MTQRSDGLRVALAGALGAWLAVSSPASAGGPAADPPATDGWTMFRGDPRGTGQAASGLPREPQPLWTFQAEDGIESTAAIHGGTVYVGSLDGNLYALDAASGSLRWKYKAQDAIKSSPSVHRGLVLFGDERGILHAVDHATGARRWSFATEAGIVSSPAVAGDRIVFGSYDDGLYCLQVADGALAWKVETGGYVHGTPAVVEYAGGRVAVASGCDGFLRMVRVSDGEEIRKVPLGGYVAASPAVQGGRAFLGSFQNEVLAVDLDAGEVAWRFSDPERPFPFYASAAVRGDLVVVAGRDKQVRGLSAATGEPRWTHGTRARLDASPVLAGDRVVAATGGGEILLLEARTGELAWRFETGSSFTASPAVAGGLLVIGSDDGTLYAFGEGKR